MIDKIRRVVTNEYSMLLIAATFVSLLFLVNYRFGNYYGLIDARFPELNLTYNGVSDYFYWWGEKRAAGELQSIRFSGIFEALYLSFLNVLSNNPLHLNFLKFLDRKSVV